MKFRGAESGGLQREAGGPARSVDYPDHRSVLAQAYLLDCLCVGRERPFKRSGELLHVLLLRNRAQTQSACP